MINSIEKLVETIKYISESNDVVYITPHIGTDCDAIASAVGVHMILDSLNVENYIIIDQEEKVIENGVSVILDELPESVKIINSLDAKNYMQGKRVALLTVDTNKKNLIPFETLENFNDILVIDHHNLGEKSITCDKKYINLEISSASEIVYNLMKKFNISFKNDSINIANYLLSGICLDTSKFQKNVTSLTMHVVSKLMQHGADMNYVNDLFMDDYETDMRIQGLVSKTMWDLFNIGIMLNTENPKFIYSKEDLAKAADYLLKYRNTDASFALGYVDEANVYISGRSKGRVNIGGIMEKINGGGNKVSGAAKIETDDIFKLRETLETVICPGFELTSEQEKLIEDAADVKSLGLNFNQTNQTN